MLYRTVENGLTYEYSVLTKVGTMLSASPSKSLTYQHGQAYCGDGLVNG